MVIRLIFNSPLGLVCRSTHKIGCCDSLHSQYAVNLFETHTHIINELGEQLKIIFQRTV